MRPGRELEWGWHKHLARGSGGAPPTESRPAECLALPWEAPHPPVRTDGRFSLPGRPS